MASPPVLSPPGSARPSWTSRSSSCRPRPTVVTSPPGWPPGWTGPFWPVPNASRFRRGENGQPHVVAAVARLDDRVLVDVIVDGPAVATLIPHRREASVPVAEPAIIEPLHADGGADDSSRPMPAIADPEVTAVLEPDLATLDLADARVVVAGGAGLVHGRDEIEARATFALLGRVANALGGAAGATRVATDAGWTSYDRQIGTTGVAVDPDLYVAFGISGAAQHIGGLGSPRHVVSVNVDGSCPMTAMADLGLVTDARALLVELARRLDVESELAPEPEGVG